MANILTKVFYFGWLSCVIIPFLNGCAAYSSAPTHDQMKEKMVGDSIRDSTPIDRANYLTDIMTTKLRLNESQQEQVAKLNLAYSTRFSILMESDNPNISKHDEFMRLSSEKEMRLLAILSDSQSRAYASSKSDFLDTYRIM